MTVFLLALHPLLIPHFLLCHLTSLSLFVLISLFSYDGDGFFFVWGLAGVLVLSLIFWGPLSLFFSLSFPFSSFFLLSLCTPSLPLSVPLFLSPVFSLFSSGCLSLLLSLSPLVFFFPIIVCLALLLPLSLLVYSLFLLLFLYFLCPSLSASLSSLSLSLLPLYSFSSFSLFCLCLCLLFSPLWSLSLSCFSLSLSVLLFLLTLFLRRLTGFTCFPRRFFTPFFLVVFDLSHGFLCFHHPDPLLSHGQPLHAAEAAGRFRFAGGSPGGGRPSRQVCLCAFSVSLYFSALCFP